MKCGHGGMEDRGDKSRPARALWIEIPVASSIFTNPRVEAREGLVD